MTTNCEPWSIVLVPRPLTPLAAFAWYAIDELLPVGGLVLKRRFFRWIQVTSPRGALHSFHGVILNLNAERKVLEFKLLKWLKYKLELVGVPDDSNRKSLAVRDFIFQRGYFLRKKKEEDWSAWENWFKELSQISNPQAALNISSKFFRNLVENKIDPRKSKVDFPPLPSPLPPITLPEVSSVIKVTIPIVKKRGPIDAQCQHREAVDYSIKSLREGKIFQLVGQHILLAVGGPSGSGKSTLVPSLLVEMRNIIESLRSRGGCWNELNLSVELSSLDAATPVADSVILSRARDRNKISALKRPWTLALAQEAVEESAAKLRTANIVLADLPGKVDRITESLSAFVTFGGIVTDDWEKAKKEWRTYFEDIRAPILFQVKSSEASSLVTTYKPGEYIMGRINRLNRVVRGWDSFILTLAQFLLFDILPARLKADNQLISRRYPEDDSITVAL